MTEYYSRVDYIYTGGDTVFSIPFSYIDKEHIKVFVNDEEISDYNYLTDSQIQITKTILSGDSVAITRTTSINERMVVFSDTSILSEKNQNLSAQQTFNIVQEVYDNLNNHKKDVETLKPHIETAARNIEHIIAVNENKNNIDTIADTVENIETVASNISDVNAVSSDISNINAIADDLTNLDDVADDLTNIDSVANNLTNINAVNSNSTNINTVAANISDINTVEDNISNITSVANNTTNINAVAGNETNINAVNANKTNIDAVAGNAANINAVASNATNINAVNSNKNNINTVASNISSINQTGNNINEVVTVANNLGIIDDLFEQVDRIDQSKGKESGNVSDDTDLLKQVQDYAHSTFDLSKFTVVGNPTITDDGIVSGFSNSNYMQTVNVFNQVVTPNNFEIKIKYGMKTGAGTLISNYIYDGTQTYGFGIQPVGTTRINFYLGSADGTTNWDITNGSKSIYFSDLSNPIDTDNIELTLGFNGIKYYAKIGNNNPKTIADTTTKMGLGRNFLLGYVSLWGSLASDSSIDLKQFSIEVDGIPVFSGNKTGIDTIKPNNYNAVGTPVISNDEVVSGFNSSNYIEAPAIDLSKPFKIREKFKTGNIYNQFHFGCPFSLSNQPSANWSNYLEVLNSNIQFFGRLSDNTDFNLRTGESNTDNTEYEFEFSWDGTVYTLKKFKDGILQGTPASYNSTLSLYNADNCNIVLGVFDTSKSTYPLTDGSIDLNALKIYVDGNLVYQPCLKIPYTLSKTGSKIVDSIYRDRVQDVYEQYGYAPYYTLSDTDFTLPMGELYGMIEKNRFNGILGQTIFSLDPLYHDNLHLLDGALLQGDGVYKSFIDNYIKPLYNSNPARFVTESVWQTSVTNYGVCGYYVYDSTNNTVRLPKVTGFVEGTLDSSALGQLVQAGLPGIGHTHTGTTDTTGAHTHTRGTMDITGTIGRFNKTFVTSSGAFSTSENGNSSGETYTGGGAIASFKASNNWTGATSSNGDHSHTFTTANNSAVNSIYGNSNTVQPQSIKGYMYIVVATGDAGYYPTNTSGIITEVNSKADVDLSNLGATQSANFDGQWVTSSSYYEIIGSDTTFSAATTYTYDLSSYLPNDNHIYEVMGYAAGNTGATSGNAADISCGSSLISVNTFRIAGATTRTDSAIHWCGCFSMLIGTDRKIYLRQTGNSACTVNQFRLYAYRRVGTNG